MARVDVLLHKIATGSNNGWNTGLLMNQALGNELPSRLRVRSRLRRM